MQRLQAIACAAALAAVAPGCAVSTKDRPPVHSCFDNAVDALGEDALYRSLSYSANVFMFNTRADLVRRADSGSPIRGSWLAGEAPFELRAVQKRDYMDEIGDDTPIDQPFVRDVHTILAEKDGKRVALRDLTFAYESYTFMAGDVDGDGAEELFIQHSVGRGTGANVRWLTAWRIVAGDEGISLENIFRTPISGYIPTATNGMPRGYWLRIFCAQPDGEGGLRLVTRVFRSTEPDPALSDGVESLAWEVGTVVYGWDATRQRIVVQSITQ